MHAIFHLPSVYASSADDPTVRAVGATLGEAIADIASRYPALGARLCDGSGKPHAFVSFYVNGDDFRTLNGLDTELHEDDEVTVVPAIAGG